MRIIIHTTEHLTMHAAGLRRAGVSEQDQL